MTEYNKISNLIIHQFPEIYKDEGQLFIEFVKAYYKWLETETDAPLYHTRKLLDYKDIDKTADSFIIYFKEKYLKNLQLETSTSTKQLVKHSLDLYRAKGTERAIELFFRIVFGKPASVYYPAKDIFKLSDSVWKIPRYLEVTSSSNNKSLVGKEIEGLDSGATAFVERLIRKRVNSVFIEVLQISAVSGTFRTGELVRLATADTVAGYPYIIGSLTALDVIDGASGFEIGDIVEIISSTGANGLARVSDIETITGIVEFELVDGGWGFSNAPTIIVTTKVLTLSNTQLNPIGTNNNVTPLKLKTFTQPLANIDYTQANGSFTAGENVYTYHANNLQKGYGVVLSVSETNSTVGKIFLSIRSGNLEANMIYNTANAIGANSTNGYADKTATGKVYGVSSNVQITYSNTANQFSNAETVAQYDTSNNVIASGKVIRVDTLGSNGTIKVSNLTGMFVSNKKLKGLTSGANATVDGIRLDLGVANVTNSFTALDGNYIYDSANPSNTTANVILISSGSGASFNVSPNLSYSEVISISNTFLLPVANVDLANADYGVYLNNANQNTIIADALTFNNVSIGMISGLTNINPGSGYTYPPFVYIVNPLISVLEKKNFTFNIANATGVFSVGEVVEQDATGARGLVKFANTSVVNIRRMNFAQTWVANNGSNTYKIVGVGTGFTADITALSINTSDSELMGLNADVNTSVITSNSSVKTLVVTDSGYGYTDGEEVTFHLVGNDTIIGTATTDVSQQGIGSGYNKNSGSLLSSNKYLYDGEYYQDFSYEIRSPVTLDKYEDMLKRILHVAGMRYFGAVFRETFVESEVDIQSSDRTVA